MPVYQARREDEGKGICLSFHCEYPQYFTGMAARIIRQKNLTRSLGHDNIFLNQMSKLLKTSNNNLLSRAVEGKAL